MVLIQYFGIRFSYNINTSREPEEQGVKTDSYNKRNQDTHKNHFAIISLQHLYSNIQQNFQFIYLDRFLATAPILYPLKISENLCFSGAFRGYKMGMETLTRNGLISICNTSNNSTKKVEPDLPHSRDTLEQRVRGCVR